MVQFSSGNGGRVVFIGSIFKLFMVLTTYDTLLSIYNFHLTGNFLAYCFSGLCTFQSYIFHLNHLFKNNNIWTETSFTTRRDVQFCNN